MSIDHMIHYSCQAIDDDDIAAVAEVLRSDFLTTGPTTEIFEKIICEYTGAAHGIAVSSNTAGLHISCMALGVTKGDTVWTSPMSFVASANAPRYLGAKVDFVDVDPATGNMCPNKLAEKLEQAKKSNALPKAIIIVHYAGRACNMDAICALKERYGFALIEDCAHALGGHYANGTPIGSHTQSDAAVFSFHPVKPITTGEGGMIMTANQKLADIVRAMRSHGVIRDKSKLEKKDLPGWYYEQQSLGFNYRMSDIHAALGISQMKKLEHFISIRRELADRYPETLAGLPLTLPPASNQSGWHLYPVHIQDSCTLSRNDVFYKARERNVGANVHYMPIHLHPYYREMGFEAGDFPNSEAYFDRLLTIPLHQRMSYEEQDYVGQILRELLS